MGLGTLIARTIAQAIDASFFNDIRAALIGDFVGRDATGAPVAGNNLGNALYPWATVYVNDLITPSGSLDPSQLETQPYKIISGKTRTGSAQPDFIRASGSGANFTVQATTTPLVFQIAGVAASWGTDRTQAGTLAASTQNTALVSDASATGQVATRTWGEYGSGSPYYPITIATVGTNISAKVGTWQAFKIGTEYFLAYVESTTSLSRAFRGFFFDNSGNPVKRAAFSNGDTITLMSLGWVFCDSDGSTVDTSYHSPTFGFATPSSPSTGDYWFDQGNQEWNRYNGSSFVLVNRLLVGLVILDSTNCVASRSFDFFTLTRIDNTVELSWVSNTVIEGAGLLERVNVNGNRVRFETSRATWDTAANLAASTERYNAAVTASTTEYFYLTDQGETKISDMEPYWRADLLGYYHPFNPWRAVGSSSVDGSVHFSQVGTYTLGQISTANIGDRQITRAKLAALGQQISLSSGSFSMSSSTFADVTNLSVTIQTTGRTVFIGLVGDPSITYPNMSYVANPSNPGVFSFFRGVTSICSYQIGIAGGGYPPSSWGSYDTPVAGTYTYKVQVKNQSPGNATAVNNCMLVAYEL